MKTAKIYTKVRQFSGPPSDEFIQLKQENVPKLKQGDVLFEATYLTVDPYMRLIMNYKPDGSVMVGEQIARVTESRNTRYPVNTTCVINSGWRSHTVLNPDQTEVRIKPLPAGIKGLPTSLALGTLGMPGATAYIGMIKVLNISAGKTVLVTAASGAVGQVACQIAKIKGLRVIACAGSAQKCEFLKTLGVDVVFNYKTDDVDQVLSKAAPEGLDYYVDHVGGTFTDNIIINHVAKFGRVVIIGSISVYNEKSHTEGKHSWGAILRKSIQVNGLQVYEFPKQDWDEAFHHMSAWIKEGKLKYKEHVIEGFENMRQAFYQLFTGGNFGKALVKV